MTPPTKPSVAASHTTTRVLLTNHQLHHTMHTHAALVAHSILMSYGVAEARAVSETK